jgi:hypothetical protein
MFFSQSEALRKYQVNLSYETEFHPISHIVKLQFFDYFFLFKRKPGPFIANVSIVTLLNLAINTKKRIWLNKNICIKAT